VERKGRIDSDRTAPREPFTEAPGGIKEPSYLLREGTGEILVFAHAGKQLSIKLEKGKRSRGGERHERAKW